MIKTTSITPEYYSKNSRDYQLISRVYDSVFNDIKTNTDIIETLPLTKNTDRKLLDLIAYTLGFSSRHQYDNSNLYALCTSFKHLLRHKGSKKAIVDCIKLLLKAQGVTGETLVDIITKADNKIEYTVNIYTPKLKDTVLLEDVLDYILPTGFIYNIFNQDISSSSDISDIATDTSHSLLQDLPEYTSTLVASINTSTIVGNAILPPLDAPSISIEDNILTITDESGLATSFNILIDGEVKATTINTSVDLYTLGLVGGTYDVAVIAVANGYANSEASNVISYLLISYTTEPNTYGTTVIVNSNDEEDNELGTTVVL